MKIAIVAPCHIPPSEAWIAALDAEARAHKAKVIIVDDSDGKLGELPKKWDVYDYKAQEKFLGELYPEFARLFHKSSSCRIFGHIVAYKNGNDVVIGLDSDCIVPTHFIKRHIELMGGDFGSGWFNPIGYPDYSRGYPYSQRGWKVVANMGLWKNVLDINGKDRRDGEPTDIRLLGSTVPAGYFPYSGMNFALAREALFGFLFLPNFDYKETEGIRQTKEGDIEVGLPIHKFRRIDDIWGGYIFQKIMRELRQSATVGFPIVYHDTVVDAKADADEEAAMYRYEDAFIDMVDGCFEGAKDSGETSYGPDFFQALSETFSRMDPFKGLAPAFSWWAKVIKKYA